MATEKTTEKGIKIAEINNEPEIGNDTKYVAWCDFTTLKNGESTQIKKGDIITPAEIPMVWLEQALSQRFIILKSDKEKLTIHEIAERGYYLTESETITVNK